MTAILMPGAPVADAVLADVAERVAKLAAGRQDRRARHHPGRRRPGQRRLRGQEARDLRALRAAVASTCASRPTPPRPTCSTPSPSSTPTPPSTPSSSRTRCPPGSTSTRPWPPSTRPRTPTGSTRSTWACWPSAQPGRPGPAPRSGSRPCSPTTRCPSRAGSVVIVGRGPTLGRPAVAAAGAQGAGRQRGGDGGPHRASPTGPTYTRRGRHRRRRGRRADMITPDVDPARVRASSAGASRWEGRKLLSDVDESCAEVAGWITPRLGGVGVTTVAMLLRNTVVAAERRAAPVDGRSATACQRMAKIATCWPPGARFPSSSSRRRTTPSTQRLVETLLELQPLEPSFVSVTYRGGRVVAPAHPRSGRRHAAHHHADADGPPHLRGPHPPGAGRDPRRVPQGGSREPDGPRRRPADRPRRGRRRAGLRRSSWSSWPGPSAASRSGWPPTRRAIPGPRTWTPTGTSWRQAARWPTSPSPSSSSRPTTTCGLVDDLAARGVDKPVIPGIMPVTSLASIGRMAADGRGGARPAMAARLEAAGDRRRRAAGRDRRWPPSCAGSCSAPGRRACTSTRSTVRWRPARSTPASDLAPTPAG